MTDRQHASNVNGTDASSVVGSWSPLWSRWEDIPTPPEDLRDVTLTFAEGRCEVRRGEKLIRRGTYFHRSETVPENHRRLLHRK